MHAPLSRMSEAERRFLTGEFDRLPRATELAFERMRQVEEAALKYRTGAELYDYFERSARAARAGLAAVEGRRQLERFWRPADAGWERMLRSEQILARAGLVDTAREAATAYYASMDAVTRRLHGSELLNARGTKFIAGLFETVNYHARFATETLNRLTEAGLTARETAAPRGSLTLFNEQLARQTAAVSSLFAVPPERPHGAIRIYQPPSGGFNLPGVQQDELLGQDEIPPDADYETLAPLAPSSQVAADALACVMLYERCNEARLFRNEPPFFKPTARGTVAACRLALIVADDRDMFDFFVDQLYMLIYEGAGGQKQKYLVENGGIMERGECDAVWDIKQLRSKRSRHDIEHGTDGEIRKKFRELGEMYRRLGVSRFPQTREEYALLQRVVLRNLRVFLKELAERIER